MILHLRVIDLSEGRPVVGDTIDLERKEPGGWVQFARATTDRNGHVLDWHAGDLPAGVYRVVFDSAGHFGLRGLSTLYPEISITVLLSDPHRAYTIAMLVSPYAYSTYVGS
jgi:5-hydroxyisourate hydrolase